MDLPKIGGGRNVPVADVHLEDVCTADDKCPCRQYWRQEPRFRIVSYSLGFNGNPNSATPHTTVG
eukprot:6287440-Prorocentrum_lima.AAC.1